jgi:hypothetical protein
MYKPNQMWKNTEKQLSLPYKKVGQKCVTLTGFEIIQQSLWNITGVLEEAEDSHKHLHDLQWGQFWSAQHVFHTATHTAFVCYRKNTKLRILAFLK